MALLYFFNPNFWFRTPDATPLAGESMLALRYFMKKFAPAVSTYSSQGHFCALKPQKHKWKHLTTQNTRVGNTPQKQPENNIIVGLVHLFAGFSCVCVPETRMAHLYNYCVIVHTDKHYCVFCNKGIVAEGARR